MKMLDGFILEIIQGASDWIEDRYGRFAARVAFVGLLLTVPILAVIAVVVFVMFSRS